MALRKQKKPTNKEILRMIRTILQQMEYLTLQVFNGDKALDLYVEMKGDKEKFIKFLQDKQKERDQDNKKTEKK